MVVFRAAALSYKWLLVHQFEAVPVSAGQKHFGMWHNVFTLQSPLAADRATSWRQWEVNGFYWQWQYTTAQGLSSCMAKHTLPTPPPNKRTKLPKLLTGPLLQCFAIKNKAKHSGISSEKFQVDSHLVLCSVICILLQYMFYIWTPPSTQQWQTASEIPGKHCQKKKPWITAEILGLCNKRRELRKKRFEPEGSEKYKEVNNNIKRCMKKATEN